MNEALLSSKKLDWCTPQAFFEKLNSEFNFTLDAAATDKTTKCKEYFTPETDGLKSSWKRTGGVLYSVTRLTEERSGNGLKKQAKKHRKEPRLLC